MSLMREWRMKTADAIRLVMPLPTIQIMFKNQRNLGWTPQGVAADYKAIITFV
jgi:hypothetical protein